MKHKDPNNGNLEDKIINTEDEQKWLRKSKFHLIIESALGTASASLFSASVYSGDWFQAALTGTMTLFCGYQAYSTYRKIKSRKVIKKLVKDLAEKTNFLEAGLLTTCMFMADKSLGREFEFDDAQSFGEILTQKMEEYYKQFDAHKSKGDIDQTLQYFKALETLYIGMRAYLKKTHKIIEREEIVLPRDLIKRTIQKMDKQMREDAKELSLCYGYKSIVNYNR